jgi:heme-degrading monooxygenase HmoA
MEETEMTARMWRGWAAADTADEVVADLRGGALARLAASPGHVSTEVLVRPVAGGVEILTLTLWKSADAVPAGVEEEHELLVARQTVAACWEVAAAPRAIAQAA